MTRPIKFMAWDKAEKEWLLPNVHDGVMITLDGKVGTYGEVDGDWRFTFYKWVPEKDLQLYQFTGLLDKEGKEIYEGHIIRTANESVCEVVFGNFLNDECASDIDYDPDSRCEGIGFYFKERNKEIYTLLSPASEGSIGYEIIGHIAEEEE